MVLFILRDRRRKRSENIGFDPASLEKQNSGDNRGPPPVKEKGISDDNGFVRDPPYTTDKFRSSTTPLYPRASMASWAQATPEDQRFPATQGPLPSPFRPKPDDLLSLNSLDIEGILNMAAVKSARSSRTIEPLPYLAASPTYAPPSGAHLTVPRPYPARGHRREPSDVPVGPNSVAFSSISNATNPFSDNNGARESMPRAPNRQGSVDVTMRPPPGALIGLPSSPRNGSRSSRDRMGSEGMGGFGAKPSNRSTKDSMGDWYGITR